MGPSGARGARRSTAAVPARSALGYRYGGQGRFLITPILLTLPLVASVWRFRAAAVSAAAVGVVTLVSTHAHSETKPTGLRGTTPVWRLTRAEAQGLQAASSVAYLVERIEEKVPPGARLGVVVGEHDADYVLYGPRLSRKPVPLPGTNTLAKARRLGLSWVYLGRFAQVPERTPGWNSERLSDAGTLLWRLPRRAS